MKRMSKYNILDNCSSIMFALAIYAYYFQFPVRALSFVIVPACFFFLLLNFRQIIRGFNTQTFCLYCALVIYLLFSAVISAFSQTAVTRIIRFIMILTLIPLFFNLKYFDDMMRKKMTSVFIFASVLKSFVVISLGIWCMYTDGWEILREWVQEHNLGDVYPSSYFIPKIQIVGNPLLLFAFFLHYSNKKKIDFWGIIFIAAIVFAGNFAFILGLFFFIVYQVYRLLLSKKNRYGYLTPIVMLFLGFFIIIFSCFTLNQQKEKSGYSNIIRYEQAAVLTNTNFFFGSGLGNYIEVNTSFRKYDGDTYFELQTLYIYNQIGFLGLFLFYLLTLYQVYQVSRNYKEILVLYLIYMIYSFWNPYCFDATQMIVGVLINVFAINEKRDSSVVNR